VAKSTSEIHRKIEGSHDAQQLKASITLRGAIIQIVLLDLVFSLDSVITAIGLVNEVLIIIVSISIAMAVMLIFVNRISTFINAHPAVKLLALAFLFMIGTVLIVEAFHVHVPKGYIYFSKAFALAIEGLNMRLRKKSG